MARILSGRFPRGPPPPGSGNGNSPVCAAWIALNSRSSKYWIRFARTGIWASMTMTISSSGRRRASSSGIVSGAAYDCVTSALRVNANIHPPLLCVTDVFDIASGDLSLPGILN